MTDTEGAMAPSRVFESMENPSKRRRITGPAYPESTPFDPRNSQSTAASSSRVKDLEKEPKDTINGNITISATSKLAGQIVAPFLAKHIPDQYAPLGGMDSSGSPKVKDSNTKYCYRHRPDLKCRRQANEPSMDQLQHVGGRKLMNYHEMILT